MKSIGEFSFKRKKFRGSEKKNRPFLGKAFIVGISLYCFRCGQKRSMRANSPITIITQFKLWWKNINFQCRIHCDRRKKKSSEKLIFESEQSCVDRWNTKREIQFASNTKWSNFARAKYTYTHSNRFWLIGMLVYDCGNAPVRVKQVCAILHTQRSDTFHDHKSIWKIVLLQRMLFHATMDRTFLENKQSFFGHIVGIEVRGVRLRITSEFVLGCLAGSVGWMEDTAEGSIL